MVVVFDLNGTLTDPAGIGEPWGAPGLGIDVLRTAIQHALVDTILGEYRDFSEHLASALSVHVTQRSLDRARIDAALERARRLDPFPDAAAALERLGEGGHRLAVLTNSGAEAGRATLEACGLARYFDEILGVDAVRRSKPHPAAYAYALDALGTVPQETFMVAAHAWDVRGAQRAGMRVAWISRHEREYPDTAISPEVSAPTLLEACDTIVRLS